MDALTLQLVTWVSDRPRTYGEVMEAWTTTCPKMPIWEDAVSDGLVRVEGEGRMRERAVSLTARAHALLNGHSLTNHQQRPAPRRATAYRRAQARSSAP
jgi:hypothetical protein